MKRLPHIFHNLSAILLLFIGWTSQNMSAQHRVGGSMYIKIGGTQLKEPFTGGFNSLVVSNFDANNDGTEDLILFDRFDSKIMVYLRKNNTWQYAPAYERIFPKDPSNRMYFTLQDLHGNGKKQIVRDGLMGSLYTHHPLTKSGDSFAKFDTAFYLETRNRNPKNSFILYNPLDFTGTDLPAWSDIDGDGDLDYIVYDNLYGQFNLHWNYFRGSDTFMLGQYGWGIFSESVFSSDIFLGHVPHREILPTPRHAGGAMIALLDNDEDGDQDAIISNLGFDNLIFLKNGKTETGYFTDTMVFYDTIYPRNTAQGADFELPAPYYIDADGDGVKDLLLTSYYAVNNRGRKNFWYYKNTGKNNKPVFEFRQKDFLSENTLDLGAYAAPAFVDIDQDGDQDLVVSADGDNYETTGAYSKLYLFTNKGTKDLPEFELTNDNFLNLPDRKLYKCKPEFLDADGDGDIDLLLGENRGFIGFYKNSAGKGNPLILAFNDSNILSETAGSNMKNSVPARFNYNNDTIPDLLVGRIGGRVDLYVNQTAVAGAKPVYTKLSSRAWGMKGNEWLITETGSYFETYGYAAPCAVDLKNKKEKQILLGTSYGEIRLYTPGAAPLTDSLAANLNWALQYNADGDSLVPDFGARVIPAAADLNGDSIPEVLVGSIRGGLHLLRNPYAKKLAGLHNSTTPLQAQMWPNPASNGVWISVRHVNFGEKCHVQVFNTAGQSVLYKSFPTGETSSLISTASLSNGIYLVKIQSGNQVFTGKLNVLHP